MENINSVPESCQFCGSKAILFVENRAQAVCLSCGVITLLKEDETFQKGVSQERIAIDSVDRVTGEWNRRV